MSNSSPPSPLVRDYARPRSHSSCTTICNENDENDDRPPPGHGAKKTSDAELVKIADGIGMEPANLAGQPATASDPERVDVIDQGLGGGESRAVMAGYSKTRRWMLLMVFCLASVCPAPSFVNSIARSEEQIALMGTLRSSSTSPVARASCYSPRRSRLTRRRVRVLHMDYRKSSPYLGL